MPRMRPPHPKLWCGRPACLLVATRLSSSKSVSCQGSALRALDQKSNPPRRQFQINLPPIPPAIPPLIKTRCAKMPTKAHHRASLTEEHDVQWTVKTVQPASAASPWPPRASASTDHPPATAQCPKMSQNVRVAGHASTQALAGPNDVAKRALNAGHQAAKRQAGRLLR